MPHKILYLGTDPSRFLHHPGLIHLPLIQTRPLPLTPEIKNEMNQFTHVMLTSPNAARILLPQIKLREQQIFVIGRATASVVQAQGYTASAVATPEMQEGMIELLKQHTLQKAYLFYPRSSLARPLIAHYLQEQGIKHRLCDLYETIFIQPTHIPNLEDIQEIIFTSPSTVRAFIAVYGALPKNKKLTSIGAITLKTLQEIAS